MELSEQIKDSDASLSHLESHNDDCEAPLQDSGLRDIQNMLSARDKGDVSKPSAQYAPATFITAADSSYIVNVTQPHGSNALNFSHSESPADQNCDVDPLVNELKIKRTKNPKNVIFAHVNVNSLKNKFEYFKQILSDGMVDVLCCTETKLDSSYSIQLYSCNDFKCYRRDKTAQSGGMIVFVRSDIPHNRATQYEITDTTCHIENIVIEFSFKKLQLLLFCVYKNPKVPKGKFIDCLSKLYETTVENNKESILLGDINIDMRTNENIVDKQICALYDLKNLIKSPTCHKSEKGSLIDPVIVSNSRKLCSPFNVVCGVSDFHNMVGCVLKYNFPLKKPYRVHYRSYKQFDEVKFRQDVENIPFQVCDMFNDVDDQYWVFSNMYKSVLDDHAPLKTKVIRSDKIPYMTSELMKAMYKRSSYKNVYLKNRCSKNWEAYRKQRNMVTGMRRKAIRDYFQKNCKMSHNQKQFWSTIKPFFSRGQASDSNNIILKENDTVISDTQDVCDTLNDYFINIAKDIGPVEQAADETRNLTECLENYRVHSSVESIQNLVHINAPKFQFEPVTVSEVNTLLKNINCSKPSGHDCIPPKAVKVCHRELAPSVATLINISLAECQFPSDMKKCEITPVFKKNDLMKKENYRPINIIGIFPKIFESVIAKQIETFMNPMFNSHLGAYRKGHGCSQTLTLAVDEWKKALDRNQAVGMILMDLSKAFDAIPHNLLIAKMYAYGFSENACKFLLNYLTQRKQRVKIKDKRSQWNDVMRGIPQGSCLGPLLFNIFINDLFVKVEKSKLFNYADDNTLSYADSSYNTIMEVLVSDSKNAMTWFKENFMQANPSKFQVMFLNPPRNFDPVPKSITIGDCVIEANNQVVLLGISIDNKLNFDLHVSKLCQKAARQLKVLIRFRTLLGEKEKKMLFKTFLLSNFNFCPVVWNFCSKASSKNMERIQERALRFLMADYKSSYSLLLKRSGHQTLHLNRIKHIAIEVFKCVHRLNPCSLNNMFVIKETNRYLRDPSILIVPRYNTIQYGKKTFSYYGSHLWNALPNHLKINMDFTMFKSLLKAWEGPTCCCKICQF